MNRLDFLMHELTGPDDEKNVFLFDENQDLIPDLDDADIRPCWTALAEITLEAYNEFCEALPL